MTSLAKFSQLAQGKSVVERPGLLPDTNSPGVSINRLFTYQSYYDNTLLEKAILTQSSNEPIVGSTVRLENVAGYSFGLHPSSQTPVAIQPMVGGSVASPQAVILRPGQIYRPTGRLGSGRNGNFSGFLWGLPFGWLGGGLATLYVFPSSDADVAWPGDAEVLFHRQRMKILAPSGLEAQVNAFKNWPLRFPWTQALRGSTSIVQSGQPIISISNPTRVLMSLRLGALAASGTMRILFQSSNDFDLDSTGAIVATGPRFIEHIWGDYGANGGAGNLSVNYPLAQLVGEAARLACDDGGVQLVDMSAGVLTNAFVDVARYGHI